MKSLFWLFFAFGTASLVLFLQSPSRCLVEEHPSAFSIAQLPPDGGEFLDGDRAIDFRAYRRQLIHGFWRGFHREGESIYYYGYHFLPDGKFTGQHRTYQAGKVVESFVTQGKWEFDGEVLTPIGLRMDSPPKGFVLRLRLGEGTILSFESGTLGAAYRGMQLKRQEGNALP
jgi:hypothetical protein